MDLTLVERSGVVGAGVALLAPGAIAFWKASSFRGDMYTKWNARVALARAGLSERAAETLISLQEEISDRVMGQVGAFDPTKVVEDPAELREPMEEALRMLAMRERLQGRFDMLCRIGPVLLIVTIVYLASVAIATLAYAELLFSREVATFSLWVGVASAGVIASLALTYAYLNSRLEAAEVAGAGGRGV